MYSQTFSLTLRKQTEHDAPELLQRATRKPRVLAEQHTRRGVFGRLSLFI